MRDVPDDWIARYFEPTGHVARVGAAALLDATVGEVIGAVSNGRRAGNGAMFDPGEAPQLPSYADRGGPSRFFFTAPSNLRFAYSAKASRSEREAGLDDLPSISVTGRKPGSAGQLNPRAGATAGGDPERRNDHPTVKPISVMRWLVRLVTPPGGVVLDPFLGSGTTAMAALDEQMRIIGIDMTERYVEIARYRVTHRHVLEPELRPPTPDREQGRLL